MTQENQAIVVRQSGRTKLAPYGSSAEVEQLARRILMSRVVKLKGGESRKLTPVEAARMASVCITHGLDYETDLDPAEVQGEFVMIPKREAWTKSANRAIEKQGGGTFWFEERQLTDPDERMQRGFLPGQIVYEARMYDTPSIRAYVDGVEKLSAAGASWNEIKSILGDRPFISATAFYSPSTNTQFQDRQWNPHERAKKRARCACIKIKYNLPFDEYAEGADELPEDYISKAGKAQGESVVVEAEPMSKEDRQKAKAAVYGDDPEPPDPFGVQTDASGAAPSTVGASAPEGERVPVNEVASLRAEYTSLWEEVRKFGLHPKSLNPQGNLNYLRNSVESLRADVQAAKNAPVIDIAPVINIPPADPTEGLYANTSTLPLEAVREWTELVKRAIAEGVVMNFVLDKDDTPDIMADRARAVRNEIARKNGGVSLAIPWRNWELEDPKAKIDPVADAAIIQRAPKIIKPFAHLKNHIAKHFQTAEGEPVEKWGQMTVEQGVALWAELDRREREEKAF